MYERIVTVQPLYVSVWSFIKRAFFLLVVFSKVLAISEVISPIDREIGRQVTPKDLNIFFNDPASYIVIKPYQQESPPEVKKTTIKKQLFSLYQAPQKELKFVFIVPSYNNAKWYKRNLASIFNQKYDNYHVIYIDDVSTDKTADLVEAFVEERGMKERFTLIKNKERRHMAYNRYLGVHSCNDTDICIALDGDDWLKDTDILSYYNSIYQDKNVWVTYGSFIRFPSNNKGSACGAISSQAIKKNKIRGEKWTASHLKTFYAWLFKQISIENFKYQDEFLRGATDLAMMYPMLEMAGNYSKFIPKITCVYNCRNQDAKGRSEEREKRKKISTYLKQQPPAQPIFIAA